MVKNEMVEMDYGCGRCVVGKGKGERRITKAQRDEM